MSQNMRESINPMPGGRVWNLFRRMVAGLSLATCLIGVANVFGQGNQETSKFPEHRPVNLPGLHAYAQKSIAAGEEIEFRVSSAVPFRFQRLFAMRLIMLLPNWKPC